MGYEDIDLTWVLLGGPKIDNETAEVFCEIEAERETDCGRSGSEIADLLTD